MSKGNDIRVSVRLPGNVHAALKALAALQGRTLQDVLADLALRYFDAEKLYRRTRRA